MLFSSTIFLTSATNSELGSYTNELNQNLASLADINKLLSSGDASLETERDAILKNISTLADVTVVLDSSGAANVKIGSVDLVSRNSVVNTLQLIDWLKEGKDIEIYDESNAPEVKL